jgi:hypothetical protein
VSGISYGTEGGGEIDHTAILSSLISTQGDITTGCMPKDGIGLENTNELTFDEKSCPASG